ncbi:MAG: cytochrome c biogenesis protein CcdA [Ktedonobacteraceae bacterium]|nr:cytochrome c biogenesis protein CcdA [Ktedonobacteraceae bacterium]
MASSQISIGIAFAAGLASFLSPCVLPLVPIYLAQLVGRGIAQRTENQRILSQRLEVFFHAAIFVAGFTIAFVALGATASTLGSFLRAHLVLVQQIGGIILILTGLHLVGVLELPFLLAQKRFDFRPQRPGYAASLLIGIVFALAWTPCVGPILGSILILAAGTATLQQGVLLLLAYSLGLGVPFLLLGLGLNWLNRLLKWLKPHLRKIEIGTGILLMIVGVMVFFNLFIYVNSLL